MGRQRESAFVLFLLHRERSAMKGSDGKNLTVLEGRQSGSRQKTVHAGFEGQPQATAAYKEIVLDRTETGRTRQLAEVLLQFSQIASLETKDFEAKLRRFLALGLDYLDLECAILAAINEDREYEVVLAEDRSAEPAAFRPGTVLKTDYFFFQQTTAQKEPLALHAAVGGKNWSMMPRCECYAGCSFHKGGAAAGLVAFMSRHARSTPFTEEEKAFLKLIAGYAADEMNRASMRSALRYRREFEQLIIEISREFINLAIEEVDQGICRALQRIAAFAGVELSYVFLFKDHGAKMDITHWWTADGKTPPFRIKDVSVEKYRWSMGQILNREVAEIPDASLLPEEAAGERRFATAQGIKSAVIVPMVYSGSCIGLVGFASKTRCMLFDEDTIVLLKTVGYTLASAVEYKRAQEAVYDLQEQMLHAQKLDSLGLLAGGIAHDFNNLLMAILGNTSILRAEIPPDAPATQSLVTIEKITQHAAELTNKLLSYAGRGKCFAEAVNVSSVIEGMREILQSSVLKKHALKFNFAADLPTIDGDPTQLSQIVLNLVRNASEAIGDTNGTIAVSTGLIAVDRKYLMTAYLCDETPEGVYNYLQIADTGCGMEKETLSRIFDPFFTTKTGGHGLGLAAVLGIVRAHRGTIKVRSTPGEGTIFTLLFPCSQQQKLPASMKHEKASALTAEPLSVLFVDDESAVREALAQILEQQNFKVITAENGKTALKRLDEHGAAIDAAVVDLNMPDLDGMQVSRQMREKHPHLPIILTSGYSEQEVLRRAEQGMPAHFIQKPYQPQMLISLLGEIVQARRAKE